MAKLESIQAQPVIEETVYCPDCVNGIKMMDKEEFGSWVVCQDWGGKIAELKQAIKRFKEQGGIICPECLGNYEQVRRR